MEDIKTPVVNEEGKLSNPDGTFYHCPLTNVTAKTKEELEQKRQEVLNRGQ